MLGTCLQDVTIRQGNDAFTVHWYVSVVQVAIDMFLDGLGIEIEPWRG